MKFLIIFIITLSCSPKKNESFKNHYNYTVDALKAEKGEPKKKSKNEINVDFEMYHYENETYQISGNNVIAKFRNPQNFEANIQYWRHLLKGIFYKIEKEEVTKSHSPFSILKCPSRGLTIYFNQKGSVIRIGESMGGKGEK